MKKTSEKPVKKSVFGLSCISVLQKHVHLWDKVTGQMLQKIYS